MPVSKNINSVKLINQKTIEDGKGKLNVIENLKDIPYEIKRIFFVHDVQKGETRGNHAHKICNQCLICLNGAIVATCDDGSSQVNYLLDSPNKLLILPSTIWSSQKYIEDSSMLMVLTDHLFDEEDYIREYNAFLLWRSNRNTNN